MLQTGVRDLHGLNSEFEIAGFLELEPAEDEAARDKNQEEGHDEDDHEERKPLIAS
ncbi:MAG: hypothetical protein HYV05_04090 [Deltaproteobacteria bacterium]|nr:hypothetical protein [Deltaproteobacteria bacterium]MBI2539136.1 hypothetical protein [Deltaproteobacteria bacterium]